jgi:hypothetical protein
MSRRTPVPTAAEMLERGDRFIAVSGEAGGRAAAGPQALP